MIALNLHYRRNVPHNSHFIPSCCCQNYLEWNSYSLYLPKKLSSSLSTYIANKTLELADEKWVWRRQCCGRKTVNQSERWYDRLLPDRWPGDLTLDIYRAHRRSHSRYTANSIKVVQFNVKTQKCKTSNSKREKHEGSLNVQVSLNYCVIHCVCSWHFVWHNPQ